MNQVSCLHSLEKSVKVGIVSGSLHSNVRDRLWVFETNIKLNLDKCAQPDQHLEGSGFLDFAAKILEDPPGINFIKFNLNKFNYLIDQVGFISKLWFVSLEIEAVTIEVAGASIVAGYLCKLTKSKFLCPRGVDYLLSTSSDSDLTEFIRRQDDGGLLYPSALLQLQNYLKNSGL
jgi:hypothetical protein